MVAALLSGAVVPARAGPIRQSRAVGPAAARQAFVAAPKHRAVLRMARVQAGEASAGTSAGVVNDDTWDEVVLNSPVPVLVDFWAPWCGPCRMIAPIIDEIAVEFGGKMKAVRVFPAKLVYNFNGGCNWIEKWGYAKGLPVELAALHDTGRFRRKTTLQVKLNTDESPGVATKYGIRSIPTVMIFKNGSKMDAVIGAVPKATLVSTVEKYL